MTEAGSSHKEALEVSTSGPLEEAVFMTSQRHPSESQAAASSVLTVLTTTLASILLAAVWVFVFSEPPRPAVEFEMFSNRPATAQVFFDLGNSARPGDSPLASYTTPKSWQRLRFEFRPGNLKSIRIDPTTNDNDVVIRDITVAAPDGSRLLTLSPSDIRPLHQVSRVDVEGDAVRISPVKGANDPFVGIDVGSVTVPRPIQFLAFRIASLSAVFMLLFFGIARLAKSGSPPNWFRTRPRSAIAAIAALAAIVSAAPIVFGGKSFLSPNHGVLLTYDTYPTLPGYNSPLVENVLGADVGAVAWHHYVNSVVQERSIKVDSELPLWNRFTGSGRTLIGQGQSMLGDPLNWLAWGLGTSAGVYDFKYVVLKMLFAVSIGLCVFSLGGTAAASAMAGAASAFISYFLYRINHPAIFSLCYAPTLLLAWIGFAKSSQKNLCFWSIALVATNWLLLNSGTAKEAFIFLLTLNLTGLALLLIFPSPLERLSRLAIAAGSMVCFALLSAPMWGTFLETLRKGTTSYLTPQVSQFAPADLVGFSENIFFLLRDGIYWPGINLLLAFGMMARIVTLGDRVTTDHKDLLATRVLAGMALICIAVAFGFVPDRALVLTPFIQSIHHIHNTFSTAAIVPACVLGGLGISYLSIVEKSRLRGAFAASSTVFAAMLGLYLKAPEVSVSIILAYILLALLAFSCLIVLLRYFQRGKLEQRGKFEPTPAALAFFSLSLFVLLARGAAWGDTPPRADRYLFNPKERVDLLAE